MTIAEPLGAVKLVVSCFCNLAECTNLLGLAAAASRRVIGVSLGSICQGKSGFTSSAKLCSDPLLKFCIAAAWLDLRRWSLCCNGATVCTVFYKQPSAFLILQKIILIRGNSTENKELQRDGRSCHSERIHHLLPWLLRQQESERWEQTKECLFLLL